MLQVKEHTCLAIEMTWGKQFIAAIRGLLCHCLGLGPLEHLGKKYITNERVFLVASAVGVRTAHVCAASHSLTETPIPSHKEEGGGERKVFCPSTNWGRRKKTRRIVVYVNTPSTTYVWRIRWASFGSSKGFHGLLMPIILHAPV